jgi:tetratricopeptide (TPR) repeat protein
MISDFDGAVAAFSAALVLDPDSPSILCRRAVAYSTLGQFREAPSDSDRAVSVSPQSAEAWSTRRFVRTVGAENAASLDMAFSDFNQAISLHDDYAPAYSARGIAYALKRDFVRAMPDLDRAIGLSGDTPRLWFNRGIVHAWNKEPDAAIGDLSQALKLAPNYVEAYMQRAPLYDLQGHRKRASEDYGNALALNGKLYKKRVTVQWIGHPW